MALIENTQINVIDSPFKAYLHYHDNNLTSVNTLALGLYFNEDMSYTFAECKNMQMNMDETWYGYYAKVKNMSHTYANCYNIHGSVTVRLATTNINSMCYGCNGLDGYALVGPGLEDYNYAYYNCVNLTGLNIKIPDASNLYNIIFRNLTGYDTSILLMNKLYIGPKCVNMSNMFNQVTSYRGVPNSGPNVKDMSHAYHGATRMTGSGVIGPNVTNATHAYDRCLNITGDFIIPKNVLDASYIANSCVNLSGNILVGNNVTNLTHGFYYCSNIRGNINLGRNVDNLSWSFYDCYLASGTIKFPPVFLPTNAAYAFSYCHNIRGDMPYFISNGGNFAGMYQYCRNLQGDVDIKEVSHQTNAAYMYQDCSNLDYINFNGTLALNINDAYCMFSSLKDSADHSIYINISLPETLDWRKSSHSEQYARFMQGCSLNNANINTWCEQIYPSYPLFSLVNAFQGCNGLNAVYYIPGTMLNVQNMFYNSVACRLARFNYNWSQLDQTSSGTQGFRLKTIFGTDTKSTNRNFNNMYFSDYVTNMSCVVGNSGAYKATDDSWRNYQGELKVEDGWSMNNVRNMWCAFEGTNIWGNAYFGPNVNKSRYAYYGCNRLNGTAFFNSTNKHVRDYDNSVAAIGMCNNLTGLYVDMPITGNLIQQSTWCPTPSSFTNLSNIEKILVGPNCVNAWDCFCQLQVPEALQFACEPACGVNVKLAGAMYKQCYKIHGDAATSPVLNNAENMYYKCYNLNGLPSMPSKVTNAYRMYSDCYNLGIDASDDFVIPLSPEIINAYDTYARCYNLRGKVDLLNMRNTVNSTDWAFHFIASNNISDTSPLVIPQSKSGANKDYMYYNTNMWKKERDLYICGGSINGAFVWRSFLNSNASNADCWRWGNNIKNVYILNCYTYGFGNSGYTTCLEWIPGVINVYANCANARNLFHCRDGVTNKNQWRSNNFTNLKKVVFGDGVLDISNAFYAINRAPINNLQISDSVKNAAYLAGSAILGHTGFLNLFIGLSLGLFVLNMPTGSNLYNSCYMFTNCRYMNANISNLYKDKSFPSNIYDCSWMFGDCINLTGTPLISPNMCDARGMYDNCFNVNGNVDLSIMNKDTIQNTGWMFNNCYNIEGFNSIYQPLNNLTCAARMFYNCSNAVCDNFPMRGFLDGLTNEHYRSSNDNINCYHMYYECPNMHGNIGLGLIYLNYMMNFDGTNMFRNCTNYNGPAAFPSSGYGGDGATRMANMYYNCQNFDGNLMFSAYGLRRRSGKTALDAFFGAGMVDYNNQIKDITYFTLCTTVHNVGIGDDSAYLTQSLSGLKHINSIKIVNAPGIPDANVRGYVRGMMSEMFAVNGFCNTNKLNTYRFNFDYSGVNNFGECQLIDINAKHIPIFFVNMPKEFSGDIVLHDGLLNAAGSFWRAFAGSNTGYGKTINIIFPNTLVNGWTACLSSYKINAYCESDNLTDAAYMFSHSGALKLHTPRKTCNIFRIGSNCPNLTDVNLHIGTNNWWCAIGGSNNIKNITIDCCSLTSAVSTFTSDLPFWRVMSYTNKETQAYTLMFNKLETINIGSRISSLCRFFDSSNQNHFDISNFNVNFSNMTNMYRCFYNSRGLFECSSAFNWNIPLTCNMSRCFESTSKNGAVRDHTYKFKGDIYFGSTGNYNILSMFDTSRSAATDNITLHIRKGSQTDTYISSQWGSGGPPILTDGTTYNIRPTGGQLIDNGWYFPDCKVVILNNYIPS